jgi:hypothetical protein
MEARTVNNLPPAASHDDDAVRCVLAIELSKKSWIVAVNTPLSDKISRLTLKPCDGKELLDLCERIRTRVARETRHLMQHVVRFASNFKYDRHLIRDHEGRRRCPPAVPMRSLPSTTWPNTTRTIAMLSIAADKIF